MDDSRPPGEGPTTVVSVSMHSGTVSAVRSRAGRRGVSAYIEAAVQRQIERDNLDELIAAAEAEHGSISADEVDDKRRMLMRGRETGAA
ncbi:hypothetical protein LWC34_42860 [Kibdelosporangium philippinense]|uniref:CopG family transcriptional regulator n=1 Tax=Kibdelosporangium philippinense TaxID=211113 RepID=A0ABS8ZRD5_9PSEU|nr:hypothetical protein [Kibdelosporangium philippinense]MCE7009505.1 hypothetical protein [Kibdelosporangium philippinense]